MYKVKIFSDSTCDLPGDIQERYDIGVMGLPVLLGDEVRADGIDVEPDDLYKYYQETGKLCTTAAPNQMDYIEFWKPWIEQGYEILHFNISIDISGAHNSARLAAEDIAEEGSVYPVDSRVLSTGIGLLVIAACEMRDAGKSAREIYDAIKELKYKHQTSFLVDTIEYLWKGGRCSSVAALGANMLKLKPMIELVEGKMVSTKKYRGRTLKCFASYADDLLKDNTNIRLDRIFVTHSGIEQEIIDLVVAKIKEHQPNVKEILVTRAGCSVSCHCGPGTLGILYLKK